MPELPDRVPGLLYFGSAYRLLACVSEDAETSSFSAVIHATPNDCRYLVSNKGGVKPEKVFPPAHLAACRLAFYRRES